MTAIEAVMTLIGQIWDVFVEGFGVIGPAIVEGLTGLLFEVSAEGSITGPSVVGILVFSLIGLSLGLSMFYVIFRIARIRV